MQLLNDDVSAFPCSTDSEINYSSSQPARPHLSQITVKRLAVLKSRVRVSTSSVSAGGEVKVGVGAAGRSYAEVLLPDLIPSQHWRRPKY